MTVLAITPKPLPTPRQEPSFERVLRISPATFKFFFALILLALLEVALGFLVATDFHMTRAGLTRHGTPPDEAFYLAITVAIFMFLIWTAILNLGPLNTVKGFILMLPVMLLLIGASFWAAGQWIVVELAGVEATRQASSALQREVAAYLAPGERPGQVLETLSLELSRVRQRFERATLDERKGAITGQAGTGPAVQRLGNAAGTLKGAEDYVADLNRRWKDLTGRVNDKLNELSQKVEQGGIVKPGEVEGTLQDVIRNMSAFPFATLRPQVEAVIGSAEQVTSTPLTPPRGGDPDAYRQLYEDLSREVGVLRKTVSGLLDQIEAFKLGPPPRLQVQPVRDVVWSNPWHYLMDIMHSIVLVGAPLLYALGPAQVIHNILMPPALPRRRDEDEATVPAASAASAA